MKERRSRELAAEALGTALLLATVVGSGIMAEKLAGGNVAVALLGNTIPTGAILVVLILALGPISGRIQSGRLARDGGERRPALERARTLRRRAGRRRHRRDARRPR